MKNYPPGVTGFEPQINSPPPRQRVCQDCAEPMADHERRQRCSGCGLLLCTWCHSHSHAISRAELARQAKEQV